MKRAYICLLLALIMMISMLPCRVQAAENRMLCKPGDTFYVVFALAEDGDRPDGVMARLVFDTDLFAVVPGLDLIGADGFSILNRHPAVLQLKVSRYAPPGEYSIEAAVIEAADADGKKYTNAKIAPVRIIVESAAGEAPQNTTAPAVEQSNAESGKKQVAAGDYVTFGHYPQTAEGNDWTAIEWLVLEVKDNKALLLSRFGLDVKPYHTTKKDVSWAACTLRSWLNNEFLSIAFNSTEQKEILTTIVGNRKDQGYSGYSTNGGSNTEDKIFLLSFAEAEKYLGAQHFSSSGSRENMKSRVSPTEYAKTAGVYMSNYKTAEGSMATWWWLRSPGLYQYYAAIVISDGSISSGTVETNYAVVCPALWVSLDSGNF